MPRAKKSTALVAAPEQRVLEMGLPQGWMPRPHQEPLWQALLGGAKRADVVAHRRWGKDEVALHWGAWRCHARVGSYWHLFPDGAQGRRALWDAVNPHTGRRRIHEAFPEVMGPEFIDSEMKVRLRNGSIWQIAGGDRYDSLVGASAAGVTFSEWSLMDPAAWTYIRPMLLENDGWALFLWTPRGRNHATRSFESRARRPDWFCQKSPATETQVFTPEQLENERAELIAELGSTEEGEARFASEYLVDFDAAQPGTYYATLLAEAERAGRIGRVPVDPSLPIDTAWDLGIDDYTAIWFFQRAGREIRVIDYFETSGEGLPEIVRQAISGRDWVWGAHHLPHDVMVRELATGRSRYETLRSLGLSRISVGAAADPEERVNAARLMIPLCWFDADRCALGVERLRRYRKRFNRATRSYTGPLHDDASHAADAFGDYALNRQAGPSAEPGHPRRSPNIGGGLSWMI
ncbi:MAG: hypothetical protein U1C74_12905 [Phenylobacterium sp.]|nr:hypothetical protein [Phenylobacterium sp.]